MPGCGGWCGWWWLIPLVGFAFMLFGCMFVFRRRGPLGDGGRGCGFFGRDRPRPGADATLEILKRRYASGEISKEQFEEMRKDLSG